jgi:deazaflavin-dependent oxidoreductase (nitroreductase family)
MTMPTDMRAFNQQLIEQFRANGGKITEGRAAGGTLLLLTTTGARSGQPRTTPMGYSRDGDRYLVVASNAGAPRHPDWYRNLVAHPEVTVEVGDQKFQAQASTVEGAERERIWQTLIVEKPYFKDHQTKVSRQIPLVLLQPIAGR